MPVAFDLSAITSVAVAALGGLAVGLERQWSGHAAGPRARFAGIRTFTMLGLTAGLSGWLWNANLQGLAVVLLAGISALVVAAYFAASRADVDGTTEVAAFVVVTAGVLAGTGHIRVASAIVAVTTLLLVEKKRLHGWVKALDRNEIRAGARFAVMAAVVLPLIPAGPFGPDAIVKPRLIWALVLFFSGLSFVGYVARRAVGANRGYLLAGTLGGLLSSTSVTLTFSRLSRNHESSARALAAGTIGACTTLLPRILIATAVLTPALSMRLLPYFIAPMAIGLVLAWRVWRTDRSHAGTPRASGNPLQFMAAIQMAVMFQAVLFAMAFAQRHFGQSGIYATAALLGLTDMDALTVSMANLTTGGTATGITAVAVMIGIIANTIVKIGIAVVVGRGAYRPLTAIGLGLMGAALAAGIYWVK